MSLYVPVKFQKAGRIFAIMGINKEGKAQIFQDTDSNPNTVTVSLNIEGYAFDLIYKD